MPSLIALLQKKGVLQSPSVIEAFKTVDRADFVPEHLRDRAYEDDALPIGGGQTISQPYTVAFMLERLQVEQGDRVLDVGSGSGWQTALLAHLVGVDGHVSAFEIVPALCTAGKKNLEKYPDLMRRTTLFCKSAEHGYKEGAPFNKIIAAAEVQSVPQAWRHELIEGGRMLYPQGESLFLETKQKDGSFKKKEFRGFVFVPFIEE